MVKEGQVWKVIEKKFCDNILTPNPEDYYIVIKKITTRYHEPWIDFFYLDGEDQDCEADDSISISWLMKNAELESDVK